VFGRNWGFWNVNFSIILVFGGNGKDNRKGIIAENA